MLPAGSNGTVYLLSGSVSLTTADASFNLIKNEAIAFGSAGAEEKVTFTAGADTRFLLISGPSVTGH